MICKVCGKEYEPITSGWLSEMKNFCSNKCYENWRRFQKEPNCRCVVCGKPIFVKPYTQKRNKHGVTCSNACSLINRSQFSTGRGNHQFGLRGDKNASFSQCEISKKNHKNVEIRVYAPYRPDADENGRIWKHRLVIEENHHLFDDKFFDVIDGFYCIKKGIVVHHKDCNHLNNEISNLQLMTRSEHTKLHNSLKHILRDHRGRIIGVVKSGKNGEPCDGNTVLTSLIANRQGSSVEHRG